MYLIIKGHHYHYELENICRIFFPNEKIIVTNEEVIDDFIVITAIQDFNLMVEVRANGFHKTLEKTFCKTDDKELLLASLLFHIFCEYTNIRPLWGIQTGIRPVKLMRRLLAENSEDYGADYFKNKLLVSETKTDLVKKTLENENIILNKLLPNSFSLYVSIPFCPSRCSYCSFISHDVEKMKKLLPSYIDYLCEELVVTAEILKKLGLTLQTIYFGGGTPTTLEADDLERIMTTVKEHFDCSRVDEYTVEAGRPDTITVDKLKAIKNGGATRICINPQTMNDEILRKIKRKHTSKETVDTYYLARENGFDNINMDLIAGLPDETLDSFKDTIDKIIDLNPENVTIHTLSLKRSSTIVYNGTSDFSGAPETTANMLDYANEKLTQADYMPYYLYRQSRMLGNLENIGYAKKGTESFYNVFIMDECQTILSVGAGAVTKLVFDGGENIKRIFNFKFPYEYISRFEELIARKNSILDYFNT